MSYGICWIITGISLEIRYEREGDAGKKSVPVLPTPVLILSQQTRPAKVTIVNPTTGIGYCTLVEILKERTK
jgi:hypothetical protein